MNHCIIRVVPTLEVTCGISLGQRATLRIVPIGKANQKLVGNWCMLLMGFQSSQVANTQN